MPKVEVKTGSGWKRIAEYPADQYDIAEEYKEAMEGQNPGETYRTT